MVIADDRLTFVGSDKAAQEYINDQTTIFDLKGKTVLPGLIDAHMHFGNVGNIKMKIDAFWNPKPDIIDAVRKAADSAENGEWIEGRGWNQEVWDPRITQPGWN